MDNWKMQEEMITLYHLRDWYGNVKQKRNNKTQSAIQQSVNQEATDAQCGNKGSPQPGASFLRQLTIHSSLQHAIKRVERPGEFFFVRARCLSAGLWS